jgi:hypothetical protein
MLRQEGHTKEQNEYYQAQQMLAIKSHSASIPHNVRDYYPNMPS